MPGSPRTQISTPNPASPRAVHPAALLGFCALAGLALSFTRAPAALALAAPLLLALALRAERRAVRAEAPLLILALVVFLAHLLLSGRPVRESLAPAGTIALRLLALVYLTRWAARAFLPRISRWLFSRPGPRRPRAAALLFDSGRMTVALLPLALREAERQHAALRSRGLKPAAGAGGRARYLAAWILPYLGTMLRVGESYADALLARGATLGAPRRGAPAPPWGLRESALLLGAGAVAAWMIRAS